MDILNQLQFAFNVHFETILDVKVTLNFGNDDNWFILALKQFNLNVNSFSDALQTGSVQTSLDGKTSFLVLIEPKDHSSLVPFLSNFECFIN